ncbi:hypothetical protein HY3_04500 [Hyphomonas pacifica]|uniref:Uncharacterized protein n=1 Tax=Hyphomonas pacifica TaxID=1280941 RepID=A0A062TUB9_9PROT|nr:hypothetical protein HY2_04800 [Hyphomonas pacifica]RAN31355.1 hypothetical protein HY3_04500 [Hyphomonas pacifica]
MAQDAPLYSKLYKSGSRCVKGMLVLLAKAPGKLERRGVRPSQPPLRETRFILEFANEYRMPPKIGSAFYLPRALKEIISQVLREMRNVISRKPQIWRMKRP